MDLRRRSVEVILAGQHESGAYVASPSFEPYRYCWWRDGAFIADAMSQCGEVDSAERFFDWGAQIVEGNPDGPWDARYNVDGSPDRSEWPKRQLDGLGLWLWAIALHAARHGRDPERWRDAGSAVCDYLAAHFRDACIDWWEEREGVHLTTLGCIVAGMEAWDAPGWEEAADAFESESSYIKPDGSMLALVAPLEVCGPEPLTEIIELALASDGSGGVHRHGADEYYGGGEWLLLTAMLGLAYLRLGRTDDARAKLRWIEARAVGDGLLPEQTQDHLLHPDAYDQWVDKWGPPACPLLWSHAMYLRLCHALDHGSS